MIDMFWKAAVLGIVQGITEFLPISSTGHLILVDQFLHMAEGPFSKMFNVCRDSVRFHPRGCNLLP